MVPVKSLVEDEANQFGVWVYDEKTGTVSKTPVTVNHIEDALAVISSDLSAGQSVVAAGASQMRNNMKVRPYEGEL